MTQEIKIKFETKQKREVKYWIFSLYYWNPVIWICSILFAVYSLWDGGLKEYLMETRQFIKELKWR